MIEIVIVLAILGIVAVIAVDSFRGMGEKYRVEGEAKHLYADLMDARGRALQRNRTFFVRFEASGLRYRIYEDTNPPPDGDSAFTNADTLAADASSRDPIISGLPGGALNFVFNRDGTASPTGHFRFSSTAGPDYDCVGIGTTRLNLGKYDAGTGTCVEK